MSLFHVLARHSGAPEKLLPHKVAPEISTVIDQNIKTVQALRAHSARTKRRGDRVADAITRFSGSMPFLYVHAVWFGVWILVNVGSHPILPFDPYPFGLLTMVVSLEAIFLSTFVLISQNRMGAISDKRADLDLQINMLSEYEVTRILRLVDAMATKMGIEEALDPELEELKRRTTPESVIERLDGE